MTEQEMKILHDVIIYDAQRMYFDHFVPANLDAAYSQFERTKNQSNPTTRARVVVGHIDGTTICRALWTEMSYNPLRFGVTSPFTPNGVESVSDFCKTSIPKDAPAFKTLKKVQYYMTEFMRLNYNSDQIRTHDGTVWVSRINGHSDENYQTLSLLRKMIHAIATQNLEDLNRKKYRIEMEKVIKARHPNGIRGNKPVYVKETTSAEISSAVSQITGIKPVVPEPEKKPVVIEEPSLFDQVPVAKPKVPQYDIPDTFEDTENERIQIETDKIWKAKDEIVSVDEYKRQEIEQHLIEQYQQESKKTKVTAKQSKGKRR